MNIIDQINTMRRRQDLTLEEKNIEESKMLLEHHEKCVTGFNSLDLVPGKFSREPSITQPGVHYLYGTRYCDLDRSWR